MIFIMEFMAVVAICLTPVFVAITAGIVHTKRVARRDRYANCLRNIKRLEAELWPELYGVSYEKRIWVVDNPQDIQMIRNPYELAMERRIPGKVGPG